MKGEHQPDANGGCWKFIWCECRKAPPPHCGYCGRAVERLQGPTPDHYALRHVHLPTRLADLNAQRGAGR